MLFVVRHYLFFYDKLGIIHKLRSGLTLGRIDTFYLYGIHLHIWALTKKNVGLWIHYSLSRAFALSVVLFNIFNFWIFADIKWMNARMLARILSAVMNATARDNRNIAVFADEEVVVNRFF